MSARARILVVDDHPLLRGGLSQMIAEDPELAVFGEAGDAGATILAVDNDPPPDLIILDLMLGNQDGLELVKQICMLRPGLPILVISMFEEWLYAERALRAGASGYIMKKELPSEVLKAVKAVLRGEIYLSCRMRVLLADKGLVPDALSSLVPKAKPPLSDRELHVYRLIGAGLTTKQIADVLHLSVKTIETYRENLKAKLNLHNAAQLLHSAREWVCETN
jgi:DNA-binding NarL/FixJ family response regulator